MCTTDYQFTLYSTVILYIDLCITTLQVYFKIRTYAYTYVVSTVLDDSFSGFYCWKNVLVKTVFFAAKGGIAGGWMDFQYTVFDIGCAADISKR